MRPRRCQALGALLVLMLVPAAARAAAPWTASGPPGRVHLDGLWTLRSDHHDIGIRRGWMHQDFIGSTVSVPFATNANPHRLTSEGSALNAGTIAWYRTSFSVSRAGDYALDFQSVNHRAIVWLDGHRLGAEHVGEFLPFSKTFHAAGPGSHRLVVRVDYGNLPAQNRSGWHRTWFNYGGIAREVTVRPLGASDIVSPTLTTTLAPGGAAIVRLTVHVHNRVGARTIGLTGALTHDGQRTTIPFAPVGVGAGGWRVLRAQVRIPSPALWSPADPELYQLSLQVPGESGWSGPTGLRQLTWQGRRIFINGHRVVLHGASLQEDAYGHGDALDPADMDRIVAELKAVGANATRAQHPLTPALLERLDAAGILVWQEIGPNDSPGNWTSRTPALRRLARDRVRESYFQLQLHPSIVAWSLANEIAGGGHTGGQAQFVDAAAQELHRRDPGRMVGVDVWGTHVPATDRGLLLYRHLDIVGLTNYAGWYSDTGAHGSRLQRIARRAVDGFARVFADKVIVVSEFGAEANGHNATGRPGGFAFQARLLRDHVAAYRSDDRLAGMLVWVLRDFAVPPSFGGGSIRGSVPGIHLVSGLNQKGLFDYRGRAKPAVATLRGLFAGLPASP
jgi:beta-galactosidase/beta-glucuronidase